MRYPQCVQDSIMIFWPLDLWVDSRDDVDLLDLRSTWSRLRVKVSNGQKIMIEYKKLWGCLICNTRMWIIDGKMNKRFPRPSDGCNHHGLGSQSFSVSNNFAQNPSATPWVRTLVSRYLVRYLDISVAPEKNPIGKVRFRSFIDLQA